MDSPLGGGKGLSTKENKLFLMFFFVAVLLTTKPRGGGLKDCPLNGNFFTASLSNYM